MRCNGNTINNWTIRQIHLKQYLINARQSVLASPYIVATAHECKKRIARQFGTFFVGQEKNFTQSTIWDYAIFHRSQSKCGVFSYCFPAILHIYYIEVKRGRAFDLCSLQIKAQSKGYETPNRCHAKANPKQSKQTTCHCISDTIFSFFVF